MVHPIPTKLKKAAMRIFFIQVVHNARLGKMIDEFTKIFLTPKMNIAPNLMTHRARGCRREMMGMLTFNHANKLQIAYNLVGFNTFFLKGKICV